MQSVEVPRQGARRTSNDLVASFEERMSRSMTVPSQSTGPSHSPKLGSEVRVGQHTFRITGLLGRGSFSSVWSATRIDDLQEVALKETLCRDQTSLEDAAREAMIMECISGSAQRSPAVFACETQPTSSGTMVRIAMAKAAGDQLSSVMQRFERDAARKTTAYQTSMQIQKACDFTTEMLTQLVPTFKAINAVAFHRDISMENVLVDAGSGYSRPEFSIIDFGLAIESRSWPVAMTQVPVVGCCRYWPVSAWFIFTYGGPKLLEHTQLRMEYETQLDLHALGILALQVFVAMLPSSAVTFIPQEMTALKEAFEQYWQHASYFWEPMLNVSRGEGDWSQVRQLFIAKDAYRIIERDLGTIRAALNNARLACHGEENGKGFIAAAPLFSALIELINQGGRPFGEDAVSGNCKLASWSRIEAILSNHRGDARATESESNEDERQARIGDRAKLEFEGVWYEGVIKGVPEDNANGLYKVQCDSDPPGTCTMARTVVLLDSQQDSQATDGSRHDGDASGNRSMQRRMTDPSVFSGLKDENDEVVVQDVVRQVPGKVEMMIRKELASGTTGEKVVQEVFRQVGAVPQVRTIEAMPEVVRQVGRLVEVPGMPSDVRPSSVMRVRTSERRMTDPFPYSQQNITMAFASSNANLHGNFLATPSSRGYGRPTLTPMPHNVTAMVCVR